MGETNIVLFAGGPYHAYLGENLTLQCKLSVTTEARDSYSLGWERRQGAEFPQIFKFVVSGGSGTSLHKNRHATLSLQANSFRVTFTPGLEDSGQYRCFYNNMPWRGKSALTPVNVLG